MPYSTLNYRDHPLTQFDRGPIGNGSPIATGHIPYKSSAATRSHSTYPVLIFHLPCLGLLTNRQVLSTHIKVTLLTG